MHTLDLQFYGSQFVLPLYTLDVLRTALLLFFFSCCYFGVLDGHTVAFVSLIIFRL